MNTRKFSEIEVGQKFTYNNVEYTKINLVWRDNAGWTNAKTDTQKYKSDNGYRHFYDDQEVRQ